MFLFTDTQAPRGTPPANPVLAAIRDGADRTGAEFDYLLATAQRESALDPKARAPGSSATGLFQFIEQTWLGLVKTEGPKLGLGDQAASISGRPDGSYTVTDPAARQAILDLRGDPKVASVLAGTLTQKNRDALASELGREPSRADLYVAHFLGARGAADLIRSAQTTPTRPAAGDFPEAAAANRSIFYDRSGRALGAGEVYARLAEGLAGGPAAISAAPSFGPDQPLAFADHDHPGFHGLFQTETRRGPMSDAVAKLWQGGRTGAPGPSPSFFPRRDGTEPAGADAPSSRTEDHPPPAIAARGADASGPAPGHVADATAPLPPPRPPGLGSERRANPVPRARAPLDLAAFTKARVE